MSGNGVVYEQFHQPDSLRDSSQADIALTRQHSDARKNPAFVKRLRTAHAPLCPADVIGY